MRECGKLERDCEKVWRDVSGAGPVLSRFDRLDQIGPRTLRG